MKFWIKYFTFLTVGLVIILLLLSMDKSPEMHIEGQWKEVAWVYEKVDKNDSLASHFNTISKYVKNTVGENLIIHKAEQWEFHPNGKLILESDTFKKEVSWCMKGRGNLLEIKYDNNLVEHYTLSELSEDTLVLHFDTDTQIRGIARLTFKKTD